jgi:signal transduction histidine kinase
MVGEACATLCGIGGFDAAVFLTFPADGDDACVLGAHSFSPGAAGELLVGGNLDSLASRAFSVGALVESDDERLVALPTQMGSSQALVVASRAPDSGHHDPCLAPVLEGVTRITVLAIERQMSCEREVLRAGHRARVRIARAIHDDVIQRLFAVSLALSDDSPLERDLRVLCSFEFESALGALRSILLDAAEQDLDEPELDDHLRGRARGGVSVKAGHHLDLSAGEASVVRGVLDEAIRNARKHASPTQVLIELDDHDGATELTVVNDGVGKGGILHSAGVGLLLAATEASQLGGVLEHGPTGSDSWTVRLRLPVEERDNACDSQYADSGCLGG